MAREIKLQPINAIMAKEEADLANAIEANRKHYADRRTQIELNFQAAALLDAAGIDLQIGEYTRLYYLTIDLGERGRKKADREAFVKALNVIRQALGCPLKITGKDVSGKGKIEITLTPTEWPGVRIKYTDRLPKGSKCRIVTQRSSYKTLICSN